MQQSIEIRHRQTTRGCAVFCRPPMLISLWLIALLGLGNPLACLLHCWHQQDVMAAHAISADQAAVSQPHHGASHTLSHEQTATTDQTPPTANSSPILSCSFTHQTVSALTIAVFLSLLWLVISFSPGILLMQPQLVLRLVTPLPLRRPPRLAPLLRYHHW